MAAVTVNSYHENVNGSFRERYYNITGATGGTLLTDLHEVVAITFNDTTISKAAASGTVNQTITFTSTGTYTSALVTVTGK